MNPTQEMQRVIADPCASYWLKGAIAALMNRDTIDATYDAELLAKLFRQRCDEITGRARNP
jgi:hypothetical protein